MKKMLSDLKSGESAKVTGFVTKDSSILKKIMAMNFFVGESVFCISHWPSFVIKGEYNEVVCDDQIARLVLVSLVKKL